jgi:adenylyltransferase/sulfurtransferase
VADERFSRQVRFAPFGARGQAELGRATVAVVGLGGLGSWIAEHLVRAGVGTARLIDRDIVEESNLPRQALYSADDAARGRPKAEAAAERLAAIGGPTRIIPFVRELNRRTVDALLAPADLVLDGLDAFAPRFLLNDWCHAHGKPWVYGGAVAGSGAVLLVTPGGPCLRCLFPGADGTIGGETCETAGVFSPLTALIGALQAGEALRWLAGDRRPRRLLQVEPWETRFVAVDPGPSSPDCPLCAHGRRPALERDDADELTRLCGRDTVQVSPPAPAVLDLDLLARRWEGLGRVERTRFLARLHIGEARGEVRNDVRGEGGGELVLTVFDDGRALVRGTVSPERARATYARFVGA